MVLAQLDFSDAIIELILNSEKIGIAVFGLLSLFLVYWMIGILRRLIESQKLATKAEQDIRSEEAKANIKFQQGMFDALDKQVEKGDKTVKALELVADNLTKNLASVDKNTDTILQITQIIEILGTKVDNSATRVQELTVVSSELQSIIKKQVAKTPVVPVGIIVTDKDAVIRSVNTLAASFFSMKPSDMLGKSLLTDLEVIMRDYQNNLVAPGNYAIIDVIANKHPVKNTLRAILNESTGHYTWVLVDVIPRIRLNEIDHIVITLTPIDDIIQGTTNAY